MRHISAIIKLHERTSFALIMLIPAGHSTTTTPAVSADVTLPALPVVPPAGQTAQLAAAFDQFNVMSESLIAAYNGLQRQLEHLSERLALLMSALPAGVLVIAPDGRIDQANQAAETLLGSGLEGQAWPLIASRLHLDIASREAVVQVGQERRRLALSHTRLGDGREHIILLHDITETHQMRQAAERHERLAAMGEMVSSLAHQLRTPLAAALLYVGSLRRPEVASGDHPLLVDRAVERLQHLERLIGDMLHFARHGDPPEDIFPADQLLAEVTRTLEPLAHARGVTLTNQGPGGTVMLTGDRKALAGALTNVLDNALHVTNPGGRVCLSARPAAGHLCVNIADTGPGIPYAHQARIFEPFFTTRADGTGLGLAIARSVARAHGGDLSCRSTPGRGAEFVLTLPLDPAPRRRPPPAPRPGLASAPSR